MRVNFTHRYRSSSLFEYLLTFYEKEESYELDERKIADILTLFQFESIIFDTSRECGILFDKDNHPPSWFFTKANIKVDSSDINFPIDKLIHQLAYVPSPQMPITISVEFDPAKHKRKIIRFSSEYTKFINSSTQKEITDFDNIYKNYHICNNNNSYLSIRMTNTFGNPYDHVINDEYDSTRIFFIDAYRCIRKIQLHILYKPRNIQINSDQKELYRDEIDKSSITNNIFHNVNSIVKFGGKHIDYEKVPANKQYLNDLYGLTKSDIEDYDEIVSFDNNIEKDSPDEFIVSFFVIGIDIKTAFYLASALTNVKKNLGKYTNRFNDITFVEMLINKIIIAIRDYAKL